MPNFNLENGGGVWRLSPFFFLKKNRRVEDTRKKIQIVSLANLFKSSIVNISLSIRVMAENKEPRELCQ